MRVRGPNEQLEVGSGIGEQIQALWASSKERSILWAPCGVSAGVSTQGAAIPQCNVNADVPLPKRIAATGPGKNFQTWARGLSRPVSAEQRTTYGFATPPTVPLTPRQHRPDNSVSQCRGDSRKQSRGQNGEDRRNCSVLTICDDPEYIIDDDEEERPQLIEDHSQSAEEKRPFRTYEEKSSSHKHTASSSSAIIPPTRRSAQSRSRSQQRVQGGRGPPEEANAPEHWCTPFDIDLCGDEEEICEPVQEHVGEVLRPISEHSIAYYSPQEHKSRYLWIP